MSINNVVEELAALMKSLPLYTTEFLEIIVQVIGKYLLSCKEAYKGMSRCKFLSCKNMMLHSFQLSMTF